MPHIETDHRYLELASQMLSRWRAAQFLQLTHDGGVFLSSDSSPSEPVLGQWPWPAGPSWPCRVCGRLLLRKNTRRERFRKWFLTGRCADCFSASKDENEASCAYAQCAIGVRCIGSRSPGLFGLRVRRGTAFLDDLIGL